MDTNLQPVILENDEVDILSLFKRITKYLKTVLIVLCAFLICGVAFAKLTPVTYRSTATMAVMYEGLPNESSSAKYVFAENISKTFVQFISEDIVLDKVSEKTGYSVSELKSGLSVESNSLMLTLSFKDYNQKNAKTLLNAIMDTTLSVANSTDSEGNPQYKMLYNNLVIFSSATAASPVSKVGKYTIISFALGILVSAIYVIISLICDKKFNSSKEIEEMLNIPVFTSVPYYLFDEGVAKNGKTSKQ